MIRCVEWKYRSDQHFFPVPIFGSSWFMSNWYSNSLGIIYTDTNTNAFFRCLCVYGFGLSHSDASGRLFPPPHTSMRVELAADKPGACAEERLGLYHCIVPFEYMFFFWIIFDLY